MTVIQMNGLLFDILFERDPAAVAGPVVVLLDRVDERFLFLFRLPGRLRVFRIVF